jgi:hypothetical protein
VLERLGEAISQELPSFRRQQVLSAAEDAMIQLSHEYPQVLKAVQELRSNQARKMLRDFICDLALVLETIPKDKTIPYNEFIKSANEALSQFDEGLISLEELHRRAHSIMVGTVKLGAQFLKNEGTSG